MHSEVLKRLYLILKSFETHLELIFEVPAAGQCEVIGLLCFQHSPADVKARPQELDLRICKSLDYMAGICQGLLYREFSPVTLNPTSRPAELVVPRSSRVEQCCQSSWGQGWVLRASRPLSVHPRY